jgi:hypothetical protein
MFLLFELPLRKRSQQQPQAFQLLWVQDSAEDVINVLDRNQLALRNIPGSGRVAR